MLGALILDSLTGQSPSDPTRPGLPQTGNIISVGDLWFPTNSVVFRTPAEGTGCDSFPAAARTVVFRSCRSHRQPLPPRGSPFRRGLRAYTLNTDTPFLCLLEKVRLPDLWGGSLPVGQTGPCESYCHRVGLDATRMLPAGRAII